MPHPIHPAGRARELGGITIVVTLMLLVLLTITALGLSRNTFRQAVTAGTVRQASVVQNVADAGIEWGIYWLAPDINNVRASATGGASSLATIRQTAQSDTTGHQGIPYTTVSTSDMTTYSDSSTSQRFDLTVTYMGTQALPNNSTNSQRTSNNATNATDVNLWGVRSNGYLTYTGGPTFVHRREAWFTAPQSAN